MGNDHSQIKGLEIEQKAVEIADFWTLYGGELTNGDRYTLISIFKDAGIVNGQLWAAQSPLERFTKVSVSQKDSGTQLVLLGHLL